MSEPAVTRKTANAPRPWPRYRACISRCPGAPLSHLPALLPGPRHDPGTLRPPESGGRREAEPEARPGVGGPAPGASLSARRPQSRPLFRGARGFCAVTVTWRFRHGVFRALRQGPGASPPPAPAAPPACGRRVNLGPSGCPRAGGGGFALWPLVFSELHPWAFRGY